MYQYGTRSFSLTDHTPSGGGSTCAEVAKSALAIDPSVLEKTDFREGFPSGPSFSAEDAYSCMRNVNKTYTLKKEYAYVFTFYDRRDEADEFYAYSSKYYCDEARDQAKKQDHLEGFSVCGKVAAAR